MFKKIFVSFFFLAVIFFSANKAEAFDFDQCMDKARQIGDLEMTKCEHTQTLIEQDTLKQYYNDIARDSKFKNIISQNDLKKMYNAWQIYRDIYCKTFSEAKRNANKPDENISQENINNEAEFFREHCLHEFTVNAKDYIFSLKEAAIPVEYEH